MKQYSFLTESTKLDGDPDCKFKAGDRVKISDHIRCFQKGHTGTVIGISKHKEYGYPEVTIELDDPPPPFYGKTYTVGDSYVEFL